MYTPEQLAEITFGKKFGGGYNTEDVDSVFKQLTEDYTNLYNESISLKTKMRVIVAKLEEEELLVLRNYYADQVDKVLPMAVQLPVHKPNSKTEGRDMAFLI